MSSTERIALEEIAREYNAALGSGTAKQKRDAAGKAHQLLHDKIREVKRTVPEDTELLKAANAVFVDVRMGDLHDSPSNTEVYS